MRHEEVASPAASFCFLVSFFFPFPFFFVDFFFSFADDDGATAFSTSAIVKLRCDVSAASNVL